MGPCARPSSGSGAATAPLLRDRIDDDLLDAVIVTMGTHAHREADGVAVVPAALLGP